MEKVNGGIGAYDDGKEINYVFTVDPEDGWGCPMCDEMIIDYDKQFLKLEHLGMVNSGGTVCLMSNSHRCPFLHSVTVFPGNITGKENYVNATINCSVKEHSAYEIITTIDRFIKEVCK